jgi:uridine phosphorylase
MEEALRVLPSWSGMASRGGAEVRLGTIGGTDKGQTVVTQARKKQERTRQRLVSKNFASCVSTFNITSHRPFTIQLWNTFT